MRGEAWNRLVTQPTGTEIEAALAEVRVRALPIARRNERNRRAVRLLVLALVGVGGVAAGRASAGPLSLADFDAAPQAGMWRLQLDRGGYRPVPGPTQRWHVMKWDEYEGVRMNAGEAWVEGPPLTWFSLTANLLSGGVLNINARPEVVSDSMRLGLFGNVRNVLGSSRSGGQVIEERRVNAWITLIPGQSAVFYPFGADGGTVVRIDGPFVPAPSAARWRVPDPMNPRWTNVRDGISQGWQPVPWPESLRYAVTNVGALSVAPRVESPRSVIVLPARR